MELVLHRVCTGLFLQSIWISLNPICTQDLLGLAERLQNEIELKSRSCLTLRQLYHTSLTWSHFAHLRNQVRSPIVFTNCIFLFVAPSNLIDIARKKDCDVLALLARKRADISV